MRSGHNWWDYWIYFAAIGFAVGGWLLRELRSRAAQSWPITEGTVESTTLRVVGYGHGQREIAEVNYSYTVQGEFYSGSHEVKGESEFTAFPAGSRIVVHYKASDPAVSFADREDLRSRRQRIMAGGL